MLIPAICKFCGLAFATPNLIGGHGRVSLENVGIKCPRCGQVANIIDGVYESLGTVVRVLVSSDRSKSQLEALRHALKNAAQLKASREEIQDTIKVHTPELQSIADALPQTRAELYPFVMMLVAIIATMIAGSGLFQKKGPTDAEIRAMIEQAVAQTCQESGPSPQPRNRAERRAGGRPSRPARHK